MDSKSILISSKEVTNNNYFIGQTPLLRLGPCCYAWGGLINPLYEDTATPITLIHLNKFCITNYSSKPLVAEVWYNSTSLRPGSISRLFSSTNISLPNSAIPIGIIEFDQRCPQSPQNGNNVLNLMVQPNSTLQYNTHGKFVYPTTGSFVLFLRAPRNTMANASISFEWYEEYLDDVSPMPCPLKLEEKKILKPNHNITLINKTKVLSIMKNNKINSHKNKCHKINIKP